MTCVNRPIYGTITTDAPAWTGAAHSTAEFTGNCFFGWEVPRASVGVVVGFNDSDVSEHYTDIDHGLYFARGTVRVMERGIPRGPSAIAYVEGTRFYVVRIGTAVLYCMRPYDAAPTDYFTAPLYPEYPLPGEVIYASAAPSYYTVFLDASLYATGDSIINEVAGELWYPGVEGTPDPNSAQGVGQLPLMSLGVGGGVTSFGAGDLPFTSLGTVTHPTSGEGVLPFTSLGADIPLTAIGIGQLPFEAHGDSGGIYLTLSGGIVPLGFTSYGIAHEHNAGCDGELPFAALGMGSKKNSNIRAGDFAQLPFTSFGTCSAAGGLVVTAGSSGQLPFSAFGTCSAAGDPVITAGGFAQLPFTSFGFVEGDTDVVPTGIGYGLLPFDANGVVTYNATNYFQIFLTFNASGDVDNSVSADISEVVRASSTMGWALAVHIINRLQAVTATKTFYNPQAEIAENILLRTAERIAFILGVSDEVTAADAMAFQHAMHVVEQLLLSGQVQTFVEAIALLNEALQSTDALRGAGSASASEELSTADTTAEVFKYLALLAEALLTEDAVGNVLSIVVMENVTTQISDASEVLAHYLANVAEVTGAIISFKLADEAFTGWVMNTEGDKAISEYTNYPFNSFCELDGQYLGASEDGLFLLEGADDDGDPIDASVLTMMTDFNSTHMKRVPTAYIGYTSDGTMVLRVRAVSGGELREHWFTATQRTANAPREQVIQLGRGIRSRYWQFELANVDGADFEIDKLELYPVYLSRRT